MPGLTQLGVIHTAISLVALIAGILSFVREGKISNQDRTGKLYVVTTVLTCLTGFGIFQHGGFGKPHVLGIITLVVLLGAYLTRKYEWFGPHRRSVETVAYSATFFFHLIPAVTETTTRLPVGAPLIADRDGPELQAIAGILFLLFLAGSWLQVRTIRSHQRLERLPV